MCVYICVCIYIYIYRERERENTDMSTYIYIILKTFIIQQNKYIPNESKMKICKHK